MFCTDRVYYVHKARTAIRRVCELVGLREGSEVLAPAYNCGSEIDALSKSGAYVQLYEVDKSGYADLENLQQRITKKTKAIYITHYFGFPQHLDEVRIICNQYNLYLIEDCALSLFSGDGEVKLGTVGDISVFNFPKTLPVPDGGALVINNPGLVKGSWFLERPPFLRVFRETLPLLKGYVLRLLVDTAIFPCFWLLLRKLPIYLPNGRNIQEGIRPDIPMHYYYDDRLTNKKVSVITKRILLSCDVHAIANKRRKNFSLYLNLIDKAIEIKPLFNSLPDGVCPLHFPVVVRNRKQICQRMNELSIAAIEWWAGYHRNFKWSQYPNACFLKENVLVLPVHQQLDDEHIEFIVRKLLEINSYINKSP